MTSLTSLCDDRERARNASDNKKTRPGRGRVRFFYYKVIISQSNGVLGHFCRNILAMESVR